MRAESPPRPIPCEFMLAELDDRPGCPAPAAWLVTWPGHTPPRLYLCEWHQKQARGMTTPGFRRAQFLPFVLT